MKTEETMREFYDLVDKFIDLANAITENHNTTRISSVIMFAAARYNAFNFYMTGGSVETEGVGIDYYAEQYKLMLKGNFDETRNNYRDENPIE